MKTVKHVKRGTLYKVIGEASVQTDTPIVEGDTLVIYEGRGLWARPKSEFYDGRFVEERNIQVGNKMTDKQAAINECRDAFEKWLTADGDYPHLKHKNFGGAYLHEESSMKWDGWKTAWNTRTPSSTRAIERGDFDWAEMQRYIEEGADEPDWDASWVIDRVRTCIAANTPRPSPQSDMVAVPMEVVNFLLGAEPLDGIWFGNKHPMEPGEFWWRKRLQLYTKGKQNDR